MRRAVLACLVSCLAACKAGSDPGPDRTPPTVVWRTPTSGDAYAWGGRGVFAVFSEPLDPATVTSQTIVVRRDGVRATATLMLSEDRRSVAIQPDGALPAQVEIELTSGITDAAGNAFAGELAPWTFYLPEWIRLGDPIADDEAFPPVVSVAVDGADGVLVAAPGGVDAGFVHRFDGSAWRRLAPPWALSWAGRVSRGPGWQVWATGVKANAGLPWATRWTGSAWSARPYPAVTGRALDAWWVGAAPEPYLVTTERRTVDGVENDWLVARSWDATTGWRDVAEWEASKFFSPDVAAGPSGGAYAAWRTGLRLGVVELASGGLTLPGPAFDVGAWPAIAVRSDGLPVIAVHSLSAGVVVLAWNGTEWTQLGDVLAQSATDDTRIDLALGSYDEPIVAWAAEDDGAAAGSPRHVHVARWAGDGWQRYGPLNAEPAHDAGDVALSLDWASNPVLAWAEHDGNSFGDGLPLYRFHAARLNFVPLYVLRPVETWDPAALRAGP